MNYINIRDGHLFSLDRSATEVLARITLAGKRALRWGSNGLEDERACQDEASIPAGYVLAYDLDLSIDNQVYRLTIVGGAITYSFMPYLQKLAQNGARIEDVVTRITTRMNERGYNEIKFEVYVPDIKSPW